MVFNSNLGVAFGNTTSYAFNAVGNLTSITDARGNVTSYTYDNLNRRITETYPDAAPNTKSFTYDAVGNLLTKTDQKGQVQTHVYDDLYRLLSRSTPGWPADTFSYDVGGRMLTATRAAWVVTYTYDGANRLSQSTQGTQSIGYSYNIPAGTRTITYPSGRVITEQTDLRGRLAAVKEGAVNIATYSYDNGNRVDTRTYQNGVVADYTYDANNRITSLTHNHGATLIAGFTHQYDDEGNKKNEEKLHQTGASEAYAYDSIYRLVDYKVGPLVAGTVPVLVTQTAYNLDAVGNWDSKTTDAVTETRTHNAANEIEQTEVSGQVSAISHDANGNLIGDGNLTFVYDDNNRLIQVVSPQSVVISQYSYDALGRRISKTVGPDVTVFYYDNARIIETQETGGSGSVTTYTYGNYIDEVLTATRPAPLGTLYYHQNTLWSVHALTDAAGAVVERYTYDAYGAPQILTSAFGPLTSSAFGNRFMFTGREWDTECSLYHYRARTYGPGLGRFYSRDPLGYVDGMNLYGYVRGMPMSYADPLGLRMVTVGCTGYSGTLSVWVEGFTEEEENTLFGSVCSALRTLIAVNDALWNHEYVRPWTSAHTFTNTQLNRHLYDRQSGPLLNSVVERLRGKYVDLISEITDQPDGIKYECGFNSGPCANPNIPMYKMGGVDWNIYVCKSCFSLPQKDITGTLIHDLSHMYLQTSDYTTPFTDGIYLTGYTQQGIPIYETLMLEGSLSNYPSNMFGVEKRLQHADTISHFALMWYLPP